MNTSTKKELRSDTEEVKKQVSDHLSKISALNPVAIDLEHTAAYLSLSTRTIENLVRSGDFPRPRQLSGRRLSYLVTDLDAWLEARPVSEQLPPVNCQYGRAGKPA